MCFAPRAMLFAPCFFTSKFNVLRFDIQKSKKEKGISNIQHRISNVEVALRKVKAAGADKQSLCCIVTYEYL